MHLVQLMASPFVGGPERQVLGLAEAMRGEVRTTFLSFAESGRARPFLDCARSRGFEAIELKENFPRIGRAIGEIAGWLRRLDADLLCCNGYKPDLLGWRAARRAGVPVITLAHGWTGVTRKVRFYETLDALVMRWVDATVCVSAAMAERVRRAGVPVGKTVVIRNALDTTAYDHPEEGCRARLLACLPGARPARLVVAVGRLSPEKGFDVLIDAAAAVVRTCPDTAFVLFGDGPCRAALEAHVARLGLTGRVVLPGFRGDLERLLPGADLAVSPSHTEGLPVAVLEAMAAGLPVVATAVGGTPEVVVEGVTGWLTPPADPPALAGTITSALADDERLRTMGRAAWQRVRDEFTFAGQATRYRELFTRLVRPARRCCHAPV